MNRAELEHIVGGAASIALDDEPRNAHAVQKEAPSRSTPASVS
jgi:hypothetical protein